MRTIKEITHILEPILQKHNADLVDISISGSKRRPTMQILVDKAGGVTMDECSSINKQLGNVLDKETASNESYILDVSSPGLDRQLRKKQDFDKILNKEVYVCTKEPIDGQNTFKAVLVSLDDEFINLKTKDDREVKIPYAKIAKANLEIKF